MATPDQTLKKVEDLLAIGRGEEPEELLTALVRRMGDGTLSSWRADLLQLIDRFQPKRKARLLQLLDQKTTNKPLLVREPVEAAYATDPTVGTLPEEDAFRHRLATLADQHIFQWSTHYRDAFTRHFDRYFAQLRSEPAAKHYADSVRLLLHDHASDIFSRGYGYQMEQVGQSQLAATKKSIGGLLRFLELPLEYYLERSSDASDRDSALALRTLYSASTLGILEGYKSVRFGASAGDAVLPEHFGRIAHNLAFLKPDVAAKIVDFAARESVAVQFRRVVLPLLESLDKLIRKEHEDYYPLPHFGRYMVPQERFEVGVRPPLSAMSRHPIMAYGYLSSEFSTLHALEQARAADVALVVAPLRPDSAAHVSSDQHLADIVVRVSEDRQEVVEAAVHAWDRAIYELRSKRSSTVQYNIAREFPLEDPSKQKFYHVQRDSVRSLLRTYERQNGVRLWCSVRRSGKTTACFDLDFKAGDSAIVPQTCGTEPNPGDRLFYDRVDETLRAQDAVGKGFVDTIVRECAPVSLDSGQRVVFIVDEYETLFGRLQAETHQNPLLRYTIVQPLLNQLVEFARDNLLVFLGQQPDAHFILMDQNQLAPYVKQDSFPLFEHIDIAGTRASEFGGLVRKILTDRCEWSPGFLDALHRETAGHPFLTVEVLWVFVDWLIERKQRLRGLRLRRRDFLRFRDQKLRLEEMARCRDYSFFRQAASQAMSDGGYRTNRWLYTVYWVLREMSMTGGEHLDFSVALDDFSGILDRIPAPGPLPDANEIVRTASQANFLRTEAGQVSVRIRTLGRLAASVRPAQT